MPRAFSSGAESMSSAFFLLEPANAIMAAVKSSFRGRHGGVPILTWVLRSNFSRAIESLGSSFSKENSIDRLVLI
jgi:hypothetical protein